MEEKKQKSLVRTIVIVVILAVLILIFFKPKVEVSAELVSCIGQSSTLYVQEGCSACADQEALFGDHYGLLNTIDCKYESNRCGGIRATPTWIVGGQAYEGVQNIASLKKITNC